jgi:hypothetical protein
MSATDDTQWAPVAVALAVAAAMAYVDGLASGLALFVGLCVPLALIWFAEPISEFVGSVGLRRISRPSPAGFVRAFGWVALVAVGTVVLVALVRQASIGR